MPPCDILIFTAVPEEEKALKRAAKESNLLYEKIVRRNFEYRNLGVVGSSRVMALETEMGPFGFDGSAARAIYAQAQTRATTLISLGMAFGIDRQQQQIGDILVSTSVLTWGDDRAVEERNGVDRHPLSHYPVSCSRSDLESAPAGSGSP